MPFIKFENTNRRYENRITVTKNYNFGFPSKFFDDSHLELYKYVVLYFNPETLEVGFQFSNSEDEKHKFKLFGAGTNGKGYGGNIVATSFFKNYNIDPKLVHGRYTPEKTVIEGIGELFVIKLIIKKAADVTVSGEVQQPT